MESLKFTKDAWHYHVARWGGLRESLTATDICQYTRRFMLGCLLLNLIGALVCLVLTPIIVFASHFFIHKYNKFLVEVCIVICGVYGLGITCFGLFLAGRKLIDLCKEAARQARFTAIANGTYVEPEEKVKKQKPPKAPKEPGMLIEMYKAYKRKYCVKIQIKS